MLILQIFLSGLIVGVIIFHTAFSTPLLFKNLSPENLSKYLRSIFPRFFLLILALGFLSLFANLNGLLSFHFNFLVSITSILFSAICYLIIPATNKSSDSGDKKKFKLLHSLSVVLTILILLIQISFLVFVVMSKF